MWVSKSLLSAVNRKYKSGILSPDWTRVGAGYQKMSSLHLSDARLSVQLFNTFTINTLFNTFKCPLSILCCADCFH